MRMFFAITELIVGISCMILGILGNSVGGCAYGGFWILLSVFGYFLTDWENGWDGRHDSAWLKKIK